MLELPEAITIAGQLNNAVVGKTIARVHAEKTPHGFAFYWGDAADYPALLEGRTVAKAAAYGGLVELEAGETRLLLGDGVNLRYLTPGTPQPERHQLYLVFGDGSALCATVQMYGGMWAFPQGADDNWYHKVAREKPSPLSPEFTLDYFLALCNGVKGTTSAKALLATEQRIPGLGNGCLQDILFRAGIHPKRRIETLDAAQREGLYHTLRAILGEMVEQGGRDTEKDLYGTPGRYQTYLSAKTYKGVCPVCRGPITRQPYLGGNVYFCACCQP